MNFNRQLGEMEETATQEAIDEKTQHLHEAMVLKMVLEEQITKYNDSLN
jgi:hypothetical protein